MAARLPDPDIHGMSELFQKYSPQPFKHLLGYPREQQPNPSVPVKKGDTVCRHPLLKAFSHALQIRQLVVFMIGGGSWLQQRNRRESIVRIQLKLSQALL
ncbi:hypothetical protein D3C81_1368640 [compost metagenome]